MTVLYGTECKPLPISSSIKSLSLKAGIVADTWFDHNIFMDSNSKKNSNLLIYLDLLIISWSKGFFLFRIHDNLASLNILTAFPLLLCHQVTSPLRESRQLLINQERPKLYGMSGHPQQGALLTSIGQTLVKSVVNFAAHSHHDFNSEMGAVCHRKNDCKSNYKAVQLLPALLKWFQIHRRLFWLSSV